MKRTSFCTALFVLGAAAHAQYAVVPGANAQTAASTSGFNNLINSGARTGQLLIGANQLSGVAVGSRITGISFRLYTGAGKDFGGATWSDYSIAVGRAVAPLDGSTTLADNFVGTATTVRSGALTLAPGSLAKTATGGAPNAWGVEIAFANAYVYTGGPLGIEIRHSASSAAIASGTNLLEIARTNNAGYVGGDYRFYAGADGTATDTVGGLDGFAVARLSVAAPVPEPASIAALGLGALAFVRRRRRA